MNRIKNIKNKMCILALVTFNSFAVGGMQSGLVNGGEGMPNVDVLPSQIYSGEFMPTAMNSTPPVISTTREISSTPQMMNESPPAISAPTPVISAPSPAMNSTPPAINGSKVNSGTNNKNKKSKSNDKNKLNKQKIIIINEIIETGKFPTKIIQKPIVRKIKTKDEFKNRVNLKIINEDVNVKN